jgi:DNA helicase-2/ATP-dependent DNA helicase PcrA
MDEHAFFDGLDPAQREAVATDAAPLCILAGAGSGKTRVLTRRIAHRVATGSASRPSVASFPVRTSTARTADRFG